MLDSAVRKYLLIQGFVCEFEQQKYNWLMTQARKIGICLLWTNSIEQTAAVYSNALRAFVTNSKVPDEIISISSSSSDSVSLISDGIQENTFTTLADLLSSDNNSSKPSKTKDVNT